GHARRRGGAARAVPAAPAALSARAGRQAAGRTARSMTLGPADPEPQWLALTPADAPALAALHAGAMAALGQEPWPARAFADLLELPATLGFGARIGGETAAFILGQAAGGEAEILTLATAPPFRRRGLAEALIGLLRAQCRSRNCSALWL